MLDRLGLTHIQVLGDLQADGNERIRYGLHPWSRPLDIGGRDGSEHSSVLAYLAKLGYAERQQRPHIYSGSRGSWEYRINEAGRAFLERCYQP